MIKQKRINHSLPYILIGLVFLLNIQAGFLFYFQPDLYAPAYQLSGVPGSVATAGIGLLFLMWNVPYAFALFNPYKHRISLIQAVIMQALGVVGESFILSRIPIGEYQLLSSNIWRFIIFDGSGLLLLIIALIMVNRTHKKTQAG